MRALRLVATVTVAFAVLAITLVMSERALGLRGPFFAFTSVGAALGFVVVTMPAVRWRLPSLLVAIAGWERDGMPYTLLGVRAFGGLLRRPPLRSFNSTVYVRNGPNRLAAARDNLLIAESAHFWATTLTVPLLGWLISRGVWNAVAWIMVFHAIFNVYPLFHLRMVRARMEHVAQRRRRVVASA